MQGLPSAAAHRWSPMVLLKWVLRRSWIRALELLHIPASLEKIGENALVTYNAHNGKRQPTLREVTVAQGNARYEEKNGMLLEKWSNGKARVVVNTDYGNA